MRSLAFVVLAALVVLLTFSSHHIARANDPLSQESGASPSSTNTPLPKQQPKTRALPSPRQARALSAVPDARQTLNARQNVNTRQVLALYDSTQEATLDTTRIHRFLEFPLNHLGLTVTYWDLAKGLPSASLMLEHRSVITWFTDQISNPAAYLKWATSQARSGTRFLVLESVGTTLLPADLPNVNAFTKHIGVEFSPRWVPAERASTIVSRDASIVNFEADVIANAAGFMVTAPAGPAAKSHLVMRALPDADSASVQSAVVVTGTGGGYAAAGFVFRFDQKSQRLSWILNPFALLTQALDLKLTPVPDTTTIAGRRLYFSHIDGDGWNGLVNFDGTTSSVAEVVLDELIAQNPSLPVSVGFIAADAEPALGGQLSAQDTAAKLFELPHVEVASHTHTHPFRWSFFERYNRQRELNMVLAKRAVALHRAATSPTSLTRLMGRVEAVRNWLRSQDYSDGLPRARLRRAFDLQTEVDGALAASSKLAPDGKRAALYLWSGNTRPFEAAIRATRQVGVRNMNGGDARFDQDYPSIMYLPPVGRVVGQERQIYAVNSNEHTYTNGWRGPYDGQAKLVETWDNTDLPTRYKGMNLYYHMYGAAKPESLNALRYLLERVQTSKVIPIKASHYAAIADAFYEIKTTELTPAKWRVSNRGALQTVRFDNAASRTIDWSQSQGVLGYNAHGNALYVALDDAVPDAVVALAAPSAQTSNKARPYLVESQWLASKFKLRSCGFDLDVQGYGFGEMTWRGLRPGDYQITFAPADGASMHASSASVEDDGQLKLSIAANAIASGRLTVACTSQQ